MGPMPFMGQYVFCVHYYEILHFIYFRGMSLRSISFVSNKKKTIKPTQCALCTRLEKKKTIKPTQYVHPS